MTVRFPSPAHAAALLLVLGSAAAQAATPSHLYTLNGTLADAFGGPSLVSEGGTLGATGYTFAADQGLSLTGALPASVYTIDTTFELDATDGYRKLIDFQNLALDAGFYVLNSKLDFYPVVAGPSTAITNGTTVRATLSRDASGLVSGYLNGTLQFTFTDSNNYATFDGVNPVGQFFVDDNATGQREASSGFVDYIAVYNTALSATDIATLTGAVPEPADWALMMAGLGVVGWVSSTRRRN